MRKSYGPFIGFALVFSFLCVSEASAQSYVVDPNYFNVSIRMDPAGFVIGTLFKSGSGYTPTGFCRTGTQLVDSSYYGYASGNVDKCGWVITAFINPGGSTPANCGPTGFDAPGSGTEKKIAIRRHLLTYHASWVNDYREGRVPALPLLNDGTFCRVKYENGQSIHTLFANYNFYTGALLDAYGTMPPQHGVYWRYITPNSLAVLIRYPHPYTTGNTWAFCHRYALDDQLLNSAGLTY